MPSLSTCILIALYVFLPFMAIPQTFPVERYLAVWGQSDLQQTAAAAVLFDDLSRHKDPTKYYPLVRSLEARIDKSRDTRLKARLVMFKTLWTMETDTGRSITWLPRVMKAIKAVYPLNDRQLNAELYALYGELCLRNHELETSLFYNLQSLELQEAIGAAWFPKIGWMYFSVARSLYNAREYEQARDYARKCLATISTYSNVSRYNWVFLYDILGAAYNKTGQWDSAAFCYKKIASLIRDQDPAKPETGAAWNAFWLGLVQGYLGRIHEQQGQYDTARSLLQQAIETCIAFPELSDAAAFTNDLAGIEMKQGDHRAALRHWRQAWQWARQTGDREAGMDAAAGLAAVFRLLKMPDSAYLYTDKHHLLYDSLAAVYSRSRLNVARARIDYENTQDSLREYQLQLREQRRLRNVLIIGTLLLMIIGLLLYNRSRIRQEHRAQLSEARRLHAEQEAAEAKDKLQLFRRHIIEKMALLQTIEPEAAVQQPPVPEALAMPLILTEEDWTSFKVAFIKAYPAFFPALRKAIIDITPAQERLSALVYLRLDNTQAAGCLGISRDSVARGRRRLRDKLGLSSEAALEEYIYSLCK